MQTHSFSIKAYLYIDNQDYSQELIKFVFDEHLNYPYITGELFLYVSSSNTVLKKALKSGSIMYLALQISQYSVDNTKEDQLVDSSDTSAVYEFQLVPLGSYMKVPLSSIIPKDNETGRPTHINDMEYIRIRFVDYKSYSVVRQTYSDVIFSKDIPTILKKAGRNCGVNINFRDEPNKYNLEQVVIPNMSITTLTEYLDKYYGIYTTPSVYWLDTTKSPIEYNVGSIGESVASPKMVVFLYSPGVGDKIEKILKYKDYDIKNNNIFLSMVSNIEPKDNLDFFISEHNMIYRYIGYDNDSIYKTFDIDMINEFLPNNPLVKLDDETDYNLIENTNAVTKLDKIGRSSFGFDRVIFNDWVGKIYNYGYIELPIMDYIDLSIFPGMGSMVDISMVNPDLDALNNVYIINAIRRTFNVNSFKPTTSSVECVLGLVRSNIF